MLEVRITAIQPRENHHLWIRFNDGTEGTVDLSHLVGKGVFRQWEQGIPFESARISEETGAVTWGKDVELDTLNLYLRVNDIRPEQYFLKKVS